MGDLQAAIADMRQVDLHALALDLAPSLSPEDKHNYAEQLAALANACLDARGVLLPEKSASFRAQ